MKNKQQDEAIARWMGLKEGIGKDFWASNAHVVNKTNRYRTCRHCGKDIPNAQMAEAYRKRYKKAYVEGSLSDPLDVPGECVKTAPDYSSPLTHGKVLEKLLSDKRNPRTVTSVFQDGKYKVTLHCSGCPTCGAVGYGEKLGIAVREAIFKCIG